MEIFTHYRTAFRLLKLSLDGNEPEFNILPIDRVLKSVSIFSLGMDQMHKSIRGFVAIPLNECDFTSVVLNKVDLSCPNDEFMRDIFKPDGSNFNFKGLPIGLELDDHFKPYAITPDGAGSVTNIFFSVISRFFGDPKAESSKYNNQNVQILMALMLLCKLLGIKGYTTAKDSILVCITKKLSGNWKAKNYKDFIIKFFNEVFDEKLLKTKSGEVYLYHPEMINSMFHYIDSPDKRKMLFEFVVTLEIMYESYGSVFPENIVNIKIDYHNKLITSLKSNAVMLSEILALDAPDQSAISDVKRALLNS
jgi:hypothetical protein